LIPANKDTEVQELFQAATRVHLGNSKRAKFWTDKWLPDGSSIQLTLPVIFSFVCDSGITVAAALHNRRWIRDRTGGLSQALAQYLQLWDLVGNITLTAGQPDVLVWHRTADGAFSVKSAYEIFFIAKTQFACAKPIWKSKAPMKCRFFMLLVVHCRCLTADNLEHRGWPHSDRYVLCISVKEDCTHLFVQCQFTQEV
jgi:hypothetical protein